MHDDYSKGFCTGNTPITRMFNHQHNECKKYTFCTPWMVSWLAYHHPFTGPLNWYSDCQYLAVGKLLENNNRIQLLSGTEVEELYSRPEFNIHEQRLYFTLTQSERDVLTQFSSTKTRIFFILQLGYFKAKQQFFNFTLDDVRHDVQFITNIYYSDLSSVLLTGRISRDYIRLQRLQLLSLFNYRAWSSDFIPEVQEHVGNLLRYHPKGHNALRQLLVYFDHRRITVPSYTTLQDIFSNAYSSEDKRLKSVMTSIPELVCEHSTPSE